MAVDLKPATMTWLFAAAVLLVGALSAPPAQALDDPNSYVFVPNRESADVAVIDVRTDELVARIPVGTEPHQVIVSDTAMVMVVTSSTDPWISLIDLNTLEAKRMTLADEVQHFEVALNDDLLAVGNYVTGAVSLVSLREGQEVTKVAGLEEPYSMVFSKDGDLLFVGSVNADVVSVIDVAAGEVIEQIRLNEADVAAPLPNKGVGWEGISSVTQTPDGRLGFVGFGLGDFMGVVDLKAQRFIKPLDLDGVPWRAYPTADGRFMITLNIGDETVSVVSTETLEEVARFPGAVDMTGVNTGWFETTAFVISRGENKLLVFDLEAMAPIGEIELPGIPETGVTTPEGTKLYIALSDLNEVAVIDIRKRALVKRIENVGETPWGIHMVGALNYCH